MLRDGSFTSEVEWYGASGEVAPVIVSGHVGGDRASGNGGERRGESAHDRGAGSGRDSGGDKAARCEQLHRRLKRIVKARGALDLQEAEALREAQKLAIWRRYGYGSLVEYMEMEMGYSPRAAIERLRVANAIVELPQIAAAMEQGDLSFSGARELTRVATPETEKAWLGATAEMNLRGVEAAVSGHAKGDTPESPPDPKLMKKVLRFEVPVEVYALCREAKVRLEKELGERVDDERFLETVLRRFLDERSDEGSDDERSDQDRGGSGRAAYQVAVTLCKGCKRGWQDGGGEVAEMTPAAIERATCDAQFVGDLESGQVERATQAISPALRRKVKRRDHGRCRVPWCRAKHNLDIHHLRPRALGGGNSLENLVTLCEAHHLAHHEGTLLIEVVNGEVKFTRKEGSSFTRATRAVEAAAELKKRGFDREMVRHAVERTRTHVGTQDLTTAQWVEIALRYCEDAGTARSATDAPSRSAADAPAPGGSDSHARLAERPSKAT